MQVRAKLAGLGLSLHGSDDFVADHQTADVGAAGLLDVFLHHDVGFQPHERLQHRLGGLGGFTHHHANALGAFEQLDYQRRAADHVDQVRDVIRRVSKAGNGQAHALAGQQLQRAQLVTRAGDRHRLVQRKHTHHLELAQHGRAVEGDRCADARNDRVKAFQHFTLVVNGRLVAGDVHISAQRVDDPNFVATLASGFDQAAGGVQVGVARQNRNFHDVLFSLR